MSILDEKQEISRCKTTDGTKSSMLVTGNSFRKMANIIDEYVDHLEQDKWIPCEERLPEEGEYVLVWYEYFRFGNYNCMYQTFGIGYQYDGHWSGDVQGVKARCIAWRPLPEPYREVQDETD